MSRTRNRQRSGNGLITAAKIVFGLVLAAICACAGAWGMGFALTGEANPLKWTSSKPAALIPRTVAITNEGQALTNGCTYDMPATGFAFLSERLYSSDTPEYVAGGEITLTAELSNEYINGKFDFNVDFKDPDADWAQGKVATYYLGLEPIDGGRQVKVKYLEPFAEQIVLTATLQGSDSSDSCTIDCIQSVKSFKLDFDDYDFANNPLFGIHSIVYELGTVTGNFEFSSARLALTTDFIADFKSYLNFEVTTKVAQFNDTDVIETFDDGQTVNCTILEYSMFIDGFDDFDEAHKEAIYYAWYTAYQASSVENALILCEFSYLYNGVKIASVESNEHQMFCDVYITGFHYGYNIEPSVTLNKNYVF